ncbi:hypothetical protein JCM10213_005129 [Rhodosporidiobolus nylandii]
MEHSPLNPAPRDQPVQPSLPPELVSAILDHLPAVSPDQREGYRERQNALLSLCLVSRAFCDLAQPYLWHYVDLDGGKGHTFFARTVARTDQGKHVRSLRLSGLRATHDDLSLLLPTMPNLEELSLDGGKTAWFDVMALLGEAASLRRLSIAGARLYMNYGEVPPLPHLTSLALSDIRMFTALQSSVLQPTKLPSLRTLSIGLFRDGREPYFPRRLEALMAQLDAVQVHYTQHNHVSTDFMRGNNTAPLLTIHPTRDPIYSTYDPDPFNLPHLHYKPTDLSLLEFRRCITYLAQHVRNRVIRSIWLPPLSALKAKALTADDHSLYREIGYWMSELAEACETYNVTLGHYTEDELGNDHIIPAAFLEYAKAIKAADDAAGVVR